MKIEKVSTADAEELLTIYAPYVEETAISFEYEVPSVDEFRNRIEQISAKYPYIKAVVDGKIAGYAYAAGFKDRKAYDWSVETTIYIRKDCRQLGLGKALYENLEKLLKKMGILNMNACIAYPSTEDEDLNKNSVEFHTHMGYRLVGEFYKCGYKFHRWYNMVWMEKLIGEHLTDQNPPKFG